MQRLEQRTGIVRRFAACFTDYRSPKQIEHPLLDLITQRVCGLALGYEDPHSSRKGIVLRILNPTSHSS